MPDSDLASILAFAETLPLRKICGEDGSLYLSRYLVGGAMMPSHPGPSPVSVYLHHIHRQDYDESLHSHPWEWSQTTVLHGGDRQIVGKVSGDLLAVDGESWVRRGSSCLMKDGFVHRIVEVLPDTWTLFAVGPKTASWGFFVSGRGMVPWRDRLVERGIPLPY